MLGLRRQDLSLLRVEKGMPGFSLGQRIKGKLGMRSSTTAELVFDKVPPGQCLFQCAGTRRSGDSFAGLTPIGRVREGSVWQPGRPQRCGPRSGRVLTPW